MPQGFTFTVWPALAILAVVWAVVLLIVWGWLRSAGEADRAEQARQFWDWSVSEDELPW